MTNTIIVFGAKYLYLFPIVFFLLFFLFSDQKTKRKIFFLGTLSGLFALIITLILSHFIYDPRPFVSENIIPLISHANDNGFPSDHALISALFAFVIFPFNKKVGVLLFIFAILVGVFRVLAHVHHPLDILGSIAIAGLSVFCAHQILRKFKLV